MGGHCFCAAGAIPIAVEALLSVCSQWEARRRENDSSAVVIAQHIAACWLLVLQVLAALGMRLVANRLSPSGAARRVVANRLKRRHEGMAARKCEARLAAVASMR